jgi:hypothetical protein
MDIWCVVAALHGAQSYAEGLYWMDQQEGSISTERAESAGAPPVEYFSLHALYLQNSITVQIGKDLINQAYVVFPSPHITQVEKIEAEQRRITLQQYFPELEPVIVSSYGIQKNKIHYLYLTSYEIFDQEGNLLERISIAPGVNYRPPQFYQLVIGPKVKMLSFVVGFNGRSGWAQSGVSSDLQGIFRDLREMDIDRDSSLQLQVNAGSGMKTFDVVTSRENQHIQNMLANFHFVLAWGKMADKEDLISQILTLKTFQEVSIDLSKGAEDLQKYPLIFGNPVDPKWTSVIKKLGSEKLSESEINDESSVSGKFDLGKVFSFGGSSSKKRTARLKEMVNFNLEGEMYVPKSLHFTLRAQNSFDLFNSMIFKAHQQLDEANFRIGYGVAVHENKAPLPIRPALKAEAAPLSAPSAPYGPVQYACSPGAAITAFKSWIHSPFSGRVFQLGCTQLLADQLPMKFAACHTAANVNALHAPVNITCPDNSFLVKENSSQSPRQDRIFSYGCCSIADRTDKVYQRGSCQLSPWFNEPKPGIQRTKRPIDYTCPTGTLAAGVKSETIHVNRGLFVDRKYQYTCCSYEAF